MFPVSATSLDSDQFQLSDLYIRNGDRIWMACWRGEFVGYLNMNALPHSTPEHKDACSAQRVWVDARFRRRGIATELYNAAEAEMKRYGQVFVPSSTLPDVAFMFWKKRDPEAVKNDARNWADQYVGRPVFHTGSRFTVERVTGVYPQLQFYVQGDGVRRRIPGEQVYLQLGNPHPPAVQPQEESMPLAA